MMDYDLQPGTITEVRSLIEDDPSNAELFQLLGKLYVQERRYEESRDAYEHSLSLCPDNPWTHLFLGNWCFQLGKWTEALEWFQRAAEIMPEEPISLTCQGDVYQRIGNFDLAERAFQEAVRIAPHDSAAKLKLAEWGEYRLEQEVGWDKSQHFQ